MRYCLYSLLLLLLACGQNTEAPTASAPPTDHSHLAQEAPTLPDSNNANTQQLVVELDTTDLSPEPGTPLKLLLEGAFHKEEVWRGADKKKWLGLFFENGSYTLRPAQLQVRVVQDPIADSDAVWSGREVSSTATGAVFFISDEGILKPGSVDTAVFTQSILPAHKSLNYTYKDRTYTITSFGDSTLSPGGEYVYHNYGWRVSGLKKGKKLSQQLAADEAFDDSTYILLWAGDLDGDNIPDLLLDLSNHYNVSSYTLFLSSGAGPGKLYRQVATFVVSGC